MKRRVIAVLLVSLLLWTGCAQEKGVGNTMTPVVSVSEEGVSSDATGMSDGEKNGKMEGSEEGESMSAYHEISAEEAYEMMQSREVIVVDVRTEQEYQSGHIEHAVLIPNETILGTPPAELADKDAVILIYCRSGRRSKEAALKLIAMGYRNIYDFGGIIDWPYDVVK